MAVTIFSAGVTATTPEELEGRLQEIRKEGLASLNKPAEEVVKEPQPSSHLLGVYDGSFYDYYREVYGDE